VLRIFDAGGERACVGTHADLLLEQINDIAWSQNGYGSLLLLLLEIL